MWQVSTKSLVGQLPYEFESVGAGKEHNVG
jgi:hypothetical protein